jgi:hypothetical protein
MFPAAAAWFRLLLLGKKANQTDSLYFQMSDIFEEFRRLISRFNSEQIDYAVCGGWALAIHGAPRATVDMDFLILAEDLQTAWKIAQEFGYDVEGLPLSFDNGLIEIRRISKIERESKILITIDFLLVTKGLKEVWSEREVFDWEDEKVITISREGLIYMKQISGRQKDLSDIESLREIENES